MALSIGDNFQYLGAKPLDARLKYTTVAEMKAVGDSTMYDGCLAYCSETDKTYQWKSANTVDETTGKWREFTSGGSGGTGTASSIVTGTLLANGWSSNTQTLTITGITSDSVGAIGVTNDITTAQMEAVRSAIISVTAVAVNSVTFKCENVPSVDIPVGVLLCGAGGSGGGTSDYADLENKPSINDVELSGNKTAADLGFSTVATSGSYSDLSDQPTIPDVSDKYATGDDASTDLADGDYIPFYDSSASAKKKSLWSNIKALLKSYFDSIYQKTMSAGTGITITSGTTINATNTLPLNYSTSEQVVGTWIDGKPLYQKCVTFTSTTSTDTWYSACTLGTTCIIRDAKLWMNTSANIYRPLPWMDVEGSAKVGVRYLINYTTNGTLGFRVSATNADTFTSKSCYAILRYTKTTD